MAEFRSHLIRSGLKYTQQRRVIGEVFFASREHLSLEQLLHLAHERLPAIGYATVYRTMRVLAEAGLATEHRFGEGQTRFEPAHEVEHHDHLVCRRCGRIVEFEDEVIEQRQREIAARNGFRMLAHRLEILGLCSDCTAVGGEVLALGRLRP